MIRDNVCVNFLDSSTISNGHLPSESSVGHVEQSPKFVSTIKTNSNIVSMTTSSNKADNSDSVAYAAIENTSVKLARKSSGENKAIYKNVCHVKSPSLEVKRTNSEVGSKISFEMDSENKNLFQRSKSTKTRKSVKGETIQKAIAMLENSRSIVQTSPGGPSVSRTPSNKLSDLDITKMQGEKNTLDGVPLPWFFGGSALFL